MLDNTLPSAITSQIYSKCVTKQKPLTFLLKAFFVHSRSIQVLNPLRATQIYKNILKEKTDWSESVQ